MPALSTRMSRLAGPSWRSILYWRPLQPPPTTATRSTPSGRFWRWRSVLTLRAALGVTLTKRSSPTRKFGAVEGAVGGLAIMRAIVRTDRCRVNLVTFYVGDNVGEILRR